MEYLVNKITKEHKVFKSGITLKGNFGNAIKDWKFVYADKDGFIPWDGEEECPVTKDQEIEYRMEGTGIVRSSNPERLCWWHPPTAAGNIVSYRPVLNTEDNSVNWDEEGLLLPPVGTICYYISKFGPFVKGEITYHTRNGGAAIIEYEDGGFDIGGADRFKSLESERERWIDNVSKKLYSCDLAGNISAEEEAAKFLYDSIVSGEIPIPKQEGAD